MADSGTIFTGKISIPSAKWPSNSGSKFDDTWYEFFYAIHQRTGGNLNGILSNQHLSEDEFGVSVRSGSTFNFTDIGSMQIAGTSVTTTATELNFNDGSIAGTVVANKTIVAGPSKEIDDLTVDTNLNITGNLQTDGLSGITIAGFNKGILTDEDAFTENVEDIAACLQDLLG